MAWIKLREAMETGEETGIVYVNSDQIACVRTGRKTTEVHTADGQVHWVKDSPEDVLKIAQKSE